MPIRIRQRNPSSIQRSFRDVERLTNKEVAVGFPAGKAQAYPDGTLVPSVAAAHVYAIGVPKRDFMGLAKDDIVRRTTPIIRTALRVSNNEPFYEAAGLSAQASIQRAIVALRDPPNSPATIAAKGSSNPLIDTHHMLESVTYIVRDRTR